MQHVLETSKRVFSAAIAAATIAFSVGAAGVISPLTAKAASGGDLIKGTSLSTVYYMGHDGMRYAFPNEKTYFSWYANFNGVTTISDSELAGITLGGNVVVRPGTHFIKVTSDPKVYAVGRDGMIHWIESEDVAIDLAGSDWASNAIDVPDVFFDDYTVGTSLMTATAFEGAVFEMGGTTYVSWDGEMRELTSAGMSANNIWDKFVLDGTNIDDSALAMGSEVSDDFLALADAAQTEDGEGSSATGDLEISEASSMPAGVSVTGGANAVEVFSFDVEAGSEDATLDSIVLSMIGAGSTNNISAVYLYEGDNRLTESRTVNSSTRQVTFSNLGLDVDAGDQRTLTVRVTVATTQTASDTFGFEIAEDADITASGDVDGSFPVSGNTFTLTGSDSGTLTITKSGTVADPSLGEQDAEIGMFKMEASSAEGAEVEMITLDIDDAADHSDFKLWDGSELVANGSWIGGDLIAFDLSSDPFMIEEGDSNIFTVSADIGGQATDNIKVSIENAIDVVAIGTDFGFGLTVDIDEASGYDGSSCTSTAGKCSFSTVQGGELTLTLVGPSAGDVQSDAQDQTLLTFTLTAAQDVTVRDFDVIVYGDDDANGDATDATEGGNDDDTDGLINGDNDGVADDSDFASLTDIRIVDTETGMTLMGPMELDSAVVGADDADQTIDFTEDWSMEAGETLTLSVRADIDNGVASGTNFAAKVVTSGIVAEDGNGDDLATADIIPSSGITGYNQAARSASLTFSLASTPGDVTAVDGSQGVTVLGINAAAGEGADTTITDLTLSAYGDDDDDQTVTIGGDAGADINDYVQSCSLYDGTTLLDGPESPAANGQTIRFADINWTIDGGDTGLITVKCNFANTSVSGSEIFSFDIADISADVIAEDEDSDAVVGTGDAFNGGTTPTNVVTLADSGSLAITVGSSTPSADFVLTSSEDNHVATYRFTATNESFNVQTLTFSEEQAEDDLASADSTAYTNNIDMVTIEYSKADGTRATKSVSMSGNEAKFSGLDMYVPVGTPSDVKVMVDVPLTARDAGGSATSNEKIRIGFSDGDNSGTESFRAVGTGSGETLNEASSGIADLGDDVVTTDGVHTFVVRETKPTLALNASSPSGVQAVGRVEALRFNVTASANEDVVLSRMTFKVTASDSANVGTNDWNSCDNAADAGEMAPQDFDFYNLTDDGTTTTLDLDSDSDQNDSVAEMTAGADSPWTLLKTTGAICDSTEADVGFVHLVLPTTEIVPKGTTKTFALYIDATGASASGDDTLRIDINPDPIIGSASFLTASDLTESNVTPTDTTISVTSGAAYAVGDVLCMATDDGTCSDSHEKMLVVGISTNDLTVVRGYMNTLPDAGSLNDASDDVDRMVGTFLWKDDGVAGHSGTSDDFWGSYLVDSLTVNGNTIQF